MKIRNKRERNAKIKKSKSKTLKNYQKIKVMSRKLRIATRKSPLALWQANFVRQSLERIDRDLQIEILPMSTQGDRILESPLAKIGGKGLFVKELERALLQDKADIAVHSMKDVPMEFPSGLHLAGICEREDPSDAFVSNKFHRLEDMPRGSKIGTSSLRRQCQLSFLRPDLVITDLRGNVGTRLLKLDEGNYDAIVLATAGLIRLKHSDRISSRLNFRECLPAAGQGAVGIESRVDDRDTQDIISTINHDATATCVLAERTVNKWLQGSCQVPIASYAELYKNEIRLRALVGRVNGTQIVRSEQSDGFDFAGELGVRVAKDLLSKGAGNILDELRNA